MCRASREDPTVREQLETLARRALAKTQLKHLAGASTPTAIHVFSAQSFPYRVHFYAPTRAGPTMAVVQRPRCDEVHCVSLAGRRVAEQLGFTTLDELAAHVKACGAEEKAGLLEKLNAAAAEIRAEQNVRSRNNWKKAKAAIPLAKAVAIFNVLPVAVAKIIDVTEAQRLAADSSGAVWVSGTPVPVAQVALPVKEIRDAVAPSLSSCPSISSRSALGQTVARTSSGWSYCPAPTPAEHGQTLYHEQSMVDSDEARRYAAMNVAKNDQRLNAAPPPGQRSSWAERMARDMLGDASFTTVSAYERQEQERGRSKRIGGCVAKRDKPSDYFPKPQLIRAGLGLPRMEPFTGPRDATLLSESRSFATSSSHGPHELDESHEDGVLATAGVHNLGETESSFTTLIKESGGINETLGNSMPSIWAL